MQEPPTHTPATAGEIELDDAQAAVLARLNAQKAPMSARELFTNLSEVDKAHWYSIHQVNISLSRLEAKKLVSRHKAADAQLWSMTSAGGDLAQTVTTSDRRKRT